MNQIEQKPPVWLGAILGGLLTPPLMVVMLLGERFANLPFLPFDFFNWLARIIPGPIITFGIDSMVDTLIKVGLGKNLDSAAKTSEQLIGLMTFWVLGIVMGLVFFAVFNRVKLNGINTYPGMITAIVLGALPALISLDVNVSSSASPLVQIVWHGLLYLGFGSVFNWTYNVLGFVPVGMSQTEVERIDRRNFMIRVGGATAVLTVIGAGLGSVLGIGSDTPVSSGADGLVASTGGEPLPNSDAAVQPVPGTRPELTPVSDHYRIDILSGGLPAIPAEYSLPITGLVANEVRWSLDDIKMMPSLDEYITMSCISNRIGGSLISTTKWTGVSFQHILDQIQPLENAVALKITGADDFDEYVDLDLIHADERVMLTYAWDGEPLPLRNGFPLRTHIPDRYGMKQPKWIRKIEVVDSHEPGYWVRRGWSAEALVNATAVIDTVAVDATYSDAAGQMIVPIGGIAWAGDRRVVRVEVSIDEGQWQQAELRDSLSDRAWTIWRYDWPFTEGQHTFAVRCYEAAPEGQTDPILQIESRRGTRPDGATGNHMVDMFVRASEESAEETTQG